MNWNFGQVELKENIKLQDQIFTPDEISIFFVIYDYDEKINGAILTIGQRELIERLIVEGTCPTRRQYELAKKMEGIMKTMPETKH